jgi:hypothetical protein
MSSLSFQDNSADEIHKKMSAKGTCVVALADEAGLGKTHVIISYLIKQVKKHPRRKIKVFYVASNLMLASENAKKLMRYLKEELGEDKVHRLMFTGDYGKKPVSRILELPTLKSLKSGINLIAVTPTTSFSPRHLGTKYEVEKIEYEKLRSRSKVSRAEIKRRLVLRKLLPKWKPDLLILDEYQSYSKTLQYNREKPKPDADGEDTLPTSLLPLLIAKHRVKTILVSATPFEVKLPDPALEVKDDDKRIPMSFDVFADVISGYNKSLYDQICAAQRNYARAWEKLLHRLTKDRRFSSKDPDAVALDNARDKFQCLLKPRVLRTFRSDLAEPIVTFSDKDLINFPKDSYADTVRTHLAAHGNKGWDVNSHIFSSSLRFYSYSEHGAKYQQYALGRGITDSGRAALDKTVDDLFPNYVKGQLLEKEMGLAGINPYAPPLWVTPSTSTFDKSIEKILIFSAFKAVPIEVCERLKDHPRSKPKGKWGKWYTKKSSKPEEACIFWLRPGHGLRRLNAGEAVEGDADKRCLNLLSTKNRKDEEASKVAKKIFGVEKPETPWESRTQGMPGTDMLDALLEIFKAHRVSSDLQIETLSSNEFLESSIVLKRALDKHFGNPWTLHVMKNSLNVQKITNPAKIFKNYCQRFAWKAVWIEYFDQLLSVALDNPKLDAEKLIKAIEGAFFDAAAALSIKPLQRTTPGKSKRWESHLANHLGAKVDRDHEDRPNEIRAAFNSPFAPFVLATTSVGEEGLDFHRYCRREIHWDPPHSGSSLAQRIGRVVRFRGLLQRRHLAKAAKTRGFVWREVCPKKYDGLIPNFQLPPVKNAQFPRIMIFALPFSSQFNRALEVREHYADLKFFVGMTPDQMTKVLPGLVGSISDSTKRRLPKYIINLEPDKKNEKMKTKRTSKPRVNVKSRLWKRAA